MTPKTLTLRVLTELPHSELMIKHVYDVQFWDEFNHSSRDVYYTTPFRIKQMCELHKLTVIARPFSENVNDAFISKHLASNTLWSRTL